MTDETIDLDKHRGMSAQKQTRLRRLHGEVKAQRDELRARQDALEEQLVASPAESWEDAAEKARYLLGLERPAGAELAALVESIQGGQRIMSSPPGGGNLP